MTIKSIHLQKHRFGVALQKQVNYFKYLRWTNIGVNEFVVFEPYNLIQCKQHKNYRFCCRDCSTIFYSIQSYKSYTVSFK